MKMNRPVLWTSGEAAAMTGGVSMQNWCATGVAIAMDEIKPGDLYIATQEDDLHAVFQRGAVAAVVSGSFDHHHWPLLKVENVFEALQLLAGAARYKTHALIVSVQGRTARGVVHEILSAQGSVHEGGRHLSLGLANLPDDVDFGLFGSSPAVRPDIAIITNCIAANRDTLFETMPVNGSVVINADDENFLSVVARAKAAGIANIFTYGRHESADARLVDVMHADNGTRVRVNILGEDMTFVSPVHEDFNMTSLAGFLVLKLAQKDMPATIRGTQGQVTSPVQTAAGVSLIDPALRDSAMPQALFRVTNMIDLGFGRQTAILDNIACPAQGGLSLHKNDLAIPRRLASLDFVYTSKKVGAITNAHAVIQEKHRNARVEHITTDVITPGDFLVFKSLPPRQVTQTIFSEALRLIPEFKGRKIRTSHAV